ncbi:MAG: TRAP transporter small permease [Planctomycetes bacterium]|nr:TRAP transporter small permease [Planctomycetota bacterium]
MATVKKTYLFLERFLPGVLFVSIFLVMLLEICARLVFRKSFEWNTEYCRYALVWVTFIGAIYVRRQGSHIQVTVLYDLLEARGSRVFLTAIDIVREAVAMMFWLLLGWFGYQMSVRTARFSSSAMGISQYWLYICTAVCGLMGGILEVFQIVRLLAQGRDKPDTAAGDPA